MTERGSAKENGENALWRRIDFSGVTLVIGVGSGRLVKLLNERVAAAQGHLIVASERMSSLKEILSLRESGPLAPMQTHPGAMPLLDQTVDLLVMSGVLRQVPEAKINAIFNELWRILVPGGQLRISDILEPPEAEHTQAWAQRNAIVRKLGQALNEPTAVSVNIRRAARAVRSAGFDDLAISILPGPPLTQEWLEETVKAVHTMASRVVDHDTQQQILNEDLKALATAYKRGDQRAAERFVLRGVKAGDVALNPEPRWQGEGA
ncbi:MAG: class I SAM-dependent methyltransferase [Chloroflexota bacterium]|nr:class I SAM-dependent methyltransferase [Chloroflexota bacterium]